MHVKALQSVAYFISWMPFDRLRRILYSKVFGYKIAGDAKIDRKRIETLDHPRDMPRAGRAGGGARASRRSRAAAK